MRRPQQYPYDRSTVVARPTVPYYVTASEDVGDFRSGRALLDTGSSLCAIPIRFLTELALDPAEILRMEFADGLVRETEAYDVLLTIPTHFSQPIRVFATGSDEALIGRSVLDRWCVTFDGPRKVVDIV